MSDERRHPADELKLIGLIGALLVVMFSWVYNSITELRVHKADKIVVEATTGDRWTASQQHEYRVAVETRIQALHERIERLHKQCQ